MLWRVRRSPGNDASRKQRLERLKHGREEVDHLNEAPGIRIDAGALGEIGNERVAARPAGANREDR
jgi:hypothetical protein